jgi:hypothetical protein
MEILTFSKLVSMTEVLFNTVGTSLRLRRAHAHDHRVYGRENGGMSSKGGGLTFTTRAGTPIARA